MTYSKDGQHTIEGDRVPYHWPQPHEQFPIGALVQLADGDTGHIREYHIEYREMRYLFVSRRRSQGWRKKLPITHWVKEQAMKPYRDDEPCEIPL